MGLSRALRSSCWWFATINRKRSIRAIKAAAKTEFALGARTEMVVVNDLKDDTYFARLILNVENEFQHTIVEIDARPSDVARWRLTRARQFMLTLMSGTRWKT